MSYDAYLRGQLRQQEKSLQQSLAQMIADGQICPVCHDELNLGRPCLNCEAADHLRELLTDALSYWGINRDISATILAANTARERKLAAEWIRDARRRYR